MMTDETLDEIAGLHVLGVLDAEERDRIEQRMTQDPALRQAFVCWSRRLSPLLDTVPPLAPPPSVWAAIQARFSATADHPPSRRQNEGSWLAVAPGAAMRYLHVDLASGVRSAMLRMDKGSAVPAHDHDELEECFVLEGDVEIDGETYHAGDHVVAGTDRRHETINAVSPVRLLLHWSPAPV